MFPGMSKEELLSLLHEFILAIGNKLPASYGEAKKLIDPYLSPVTEYHCCTKIILFTEIAEMVR